jgi:magnesium transporter
MLKNLNFKHNDESIKKTLKSIQAYDLAMAFPDFDDVEKERLLYLLDIKKLKAMFVELDHDEQQELIEFMSKNKQKELLKNLENDDLKQYILYLNTYEQSKTLALLPKIKSKTIELLLTYDEDLAASIMTTEFISIDQNATIKEATNTVVTTSLENDYIDTIFVTDEDKKLVGIIDLKDLIIARPNQKLHDIMIEDFVFVYETESIEKAISTVRDYDRNAIPVLSESFHILGIVTADDIFDELIESSEDDYQKMALLSDHENTSTAMKRSMQRLPWLLLAVFLNLIIASFLSIFEETIVAVFALALFQPLILGMAGNIGTQSLAVTILGIHLDEINDQQLPKKHVLKESIVGFINSLLLGVLALGIVYLLLNIINYQGSQAAVEIAMVVGFAVFSSMFISALMGFIIPLTLNHYKIDPSVASGPIITTINDIVALVIYFGVATIAFMI